MDRHEKLRSKILQGLSDANIAFDGLRLLLLHHGFSERIKGSHHILWRKDVEEILNLQPKGTRAKPCQVRQVRNVLLRYKLGGTKDV
jgi:hypothetical protein